MATEQEQIAGLQKTIKSLRAQKRDLAESLSLIKKLGVGVVDELIGISYSGGHFDALNDGSKLLTAMSWDDYPAKSFDNLVEAIKPLSSELADEIRENGVSYFVLYNDSTRASGFYSDGFQVDTEEWSEGLDKDLISKLYNDDDLWGQIKEAIDSFGGAIAVENVKLRESKGITISHLEALSKESE